MFYGNAQSIVAFVRNLLPILMGLYRTTFIKIHHLTSILECNSNFDHWFSNTKAFLCSKWNLRKENFILLGQFIF